MHGLLAFVTCSHHHYFTRTYHLVEHTARHGTTVVRTKVNSQTDVNHGWLAKFIGFLENVRYCIHKLHIVRDRCAACNDICLGSHSVICIAHIASCTGTHGMGSVRFIRIVAFKG